MNYGIDTSYANGNVDYRVAKESGLVEWVYSRCCYGDDSWDDDGPSFTVAHDMCKVLGIPFSAYMFYCGWEDGYEQGHHFIDVADGRYGTNAVIIDVEEGSFIKNGDLGVEQNIARLALCASTIEKIVGQPILYVNRDTWSRFFGNTDAFSGHRVIAADWDNPAGSPDPIPGLPKIVGHQFSNGIVGSPPPIIGLSRPDNMGDRDVCFNLADLVRS